MKYLFIQASLLLLLCGCESTSSTLPDEESRPELYAETPESTFEHMHELDWLAGDWMDQDRPYVTENNITWNSNKTMLIQHFSIQSNGKKQFDGMQIIAWDPAQKQIRSWIFDTRGGIGESAWIKGDESWLADTSFTLPDGRKGSALHVYKKVDSNTYTFSSENRDIDGELLPNIGPFKFVKER